MRGRILTTVLLLAALVVGALAVAYYRARLVDEIKVIRIGFQPSTHHIAHVVAMEKGWWQTNLKLELKESAFPSGPPEMSALQAGDLDFAYVGVAPVIVGVHEGLKAKIIAAVQNNGSSLVVRPSLAYDGPMSLRGLKIATFPPGSIQDTLLRRWLIGNQLNPNSNLDIVAMGPGDAVAAMIAGRIDAALLPEPAGAILERQGAAKVVLRSGQIMSDHVCCVLVASNRMLQRYPAIVEKVLDTHIQATQYVRQHQEESALIYAGRLHEEPASIIHSLNIWDGRWVTDPKDVVGTTLEFERALFMLGKGRYRRNLSRIDLFDTNFYENAVK